MSRIEVTGSTMDRIHAAMRDPRLFEDLIAPYQNRIYSLCLRMAGNEQDAGDMAQEALLRIYTNLGRFRGEAQFGSWVWRITTNVCLDALRKKKRLAHASVEEMEEIGEVLPDSPEEEPMHRLEKKERMQAVEEALSSLKAEYRIPVVLRDVEGRSYEEIARLMALNLNTVKSRILRGRMQLREILRKCEWFICCKCLGRGERP